MSDHTQSAGLLETLLSVLDDCAGAFGQRRVFRRACCLAVGIIFALGRKTISQVRVGLGKTEGDWSADYRLFSCDRFPAQKAASALFKATLSHVPQTEPYTAVVDKTDVERTSRKMPGTFWGRAPRTAYFKPGLARLQRFENVCWLTPAEQGYRRAVPLKWEPLATAHSVSGMEATCKEWEAGRQAMGWLRDELDAQGRSDQLLLMACDGAYDVNSLWKDVSARTVVVTRCAKNRRLYELPADTPAGGRRGAPRKYGARLPTPQEMRRERTSWRKVRLPVRGRTVEVKCRLVGPVLVEGVPDQPLFLILVKGYHWRRGKVQKRKEPCQYLLNAAQVGGRWQMPLPLEAVVELTWQRWEIEVCHREIKTSFGLGQAQCWSVWGSVRSVQFTAWSYALMMLAGYRAWKGLIRAPARPRTSWWFGSRRWTANDVIQCIRYELWHLGQFEPLWRRTPGKGQNIPSDIDGLIKALAAASPG
jgi:hypothetical protein